MRIILTIDYSPWSSYGGGAQRSTHNIALEMARRGHEVHVINTKPPWERVEVPSGLPYRHHWAPLPAFRSKRAAFLRLLSPRYVNRLIADIINSSPTMPTVVHSNGEEGGLVDKLRPEYPFGFISTPRHPHYPDAFFKYPFDVIPIYVKAGLWLRHGKYLMQASAARHADFVSPPSRWAAATLQKAFDIPEARLKPVHNGVPREFLQYHRNEHASSGPIVFFGRFSKTKGVDTLVEALALIGFEHLPDVYIIGRGDLKTQLESTVQKNGLNEVVQFKDWMSHDELGQVLSEARMAVLPSREENFSLAILGAMCVGGPVISTKVGGTPEIITHKKNGLLVDAGDPHQLAEAIRELLNNPKAADQIARSASHHIRSNLTWSHTAEQFEQLYEEALREI